MIRDESETAKVKYGFLPTSLWYVVKDKKLLLFMHDDMADDTYAKGAPLSQFNPTVAERIIKYWSEPGDKILDPFSGRTRCMCAYNLDRHYTGYEISPKVFNYLNEKMAVQKRLVAKTNINITLVNSDSRTMPHREEFDLIFSCPPYFDVEDYNKLYEEQLTGQMGSVHKYEEFMVMYEDVIKKCYNALKKDKYCVWVVGDIRRDKQLIPFATDTINIFRKIGFKMHDIVINELNSLSILGIGCCAENKYTAKKHEYILVFKK